MSSLLQLEPGRIFARDYRVVRPLEAGGMGAVYVVEQLSTGTERALKLMHPDLVGDPRSRARFEQEAKVGARIESDHIVQVLAAGVDDETALPWLVMELLRGETLAAAIERRGFLPGEEILEIFRQAGHALGLAHAAGLVHRDLKPENIFLGSPRRVGVPFTVKILDFGIAKVIEESQRAGGVAANATQMLGSPMYMAPEQAQAGPIGPHTDVWAMGLVAFYAWTGRVYWKAVNASDATVQSLLAELLLEPLEVATTRAAALGVAGRLPQGFDPWFARCVVRDIRSRLRDGGEMVAALEASVRASVGGQAEQATAMGGGWNAPTPTPPGQYSPGAPAAVLARTGEPIQSAPWPPPPSPPTNAQLPSPFGALPATSMPNAFAPPMQNQGYGPTGSQPGFPPSGSQPGFASSGSQSGFGPPPAPNNFGAAPPSGFAPMQSNYGGPGGYTPPPAAAPPAAHGMNTGLIVVLGLVGVAVLGGIAFAVTNSFSHERERHARHTPIDVPPGTPPGTPPPGTPPGTPALTIAPGLNQLAPGNNTGLTPGVNGTNALEQIALPNDPTVTRTLRVQAGFGGALTDHHVTGSNAVVADACRIAWMALDIAGNHTSYPDLVVQLRSPRGEVETLQTHQNETPFRRFLVTRFIGESASGTWTLKVEDTLDADSGRLDGYNLIVGCH